MARPAADRRPFEDRLWDYLQSARYRNWAPVPGQGAGTYEGQAPHGAYLKMYLSRAAAGAPADLPDRSLIVKENYGPDGETLMAVTVMYRVEDYNPEAGDWYWVKYTPEGRVDVRQTEMGRVRLNGKVQGCIECHSGAGGDDFLFFNDEN